MKKRVAVDLFAGAGGLSQGLKDASFRVIGAIENDGECAATYRLNHPDTLLLEKDIQSVNAISFMQRLGLRSGELDLLAGCPPCQGYSTIGTRNKPVDNDQRNELVYEILRFTLALRPKTVMMENVPALAKNARLERICQGLSNAGYALDVKILDMVHFGVPQKRRRMILLASRLGRIEVLSKKNDKLGMVTVRNTIGNLPAVGRSGDPLHDSKATHGSRVSQFISMVPKDGGSRKDVDEVYQLECHKRTTGFRDVYGRMAWDKPSPTITGGCGNPSKGRFIHPLENRAITLREAALLQTFPPQYNFSLSSGRSRIATMIGNALPPRFINFHAGYLLNHLKLQED